MSSVHFEPVWFLTVEEDEENLMITFAVALGEPGEVASVILMRNLEDELLLPAEERGVVVSHESYPDAEDRLLRRIRMTEKRAEIQTSGRRYWLDVSRVDPTELRDARKVLRRMNFDGRFELDLG